MPRFRTVACDHCGHLVLKRAIECEVCGRMTRRERRTWMARGANVVVVLGVFAFIYFKIKGLAP